VPIIDLMNLVDQRIEDIQRENPSLKATEVYFESEEGLWALVNVQNSEGITIEYEFVESETSWKRPEAVLEYNQASLEMVKVVVIVPDEAMVDVMLQVKNYDGTDVVVKDYRELGLMPMPLAY
jgi:hypothetical protein